MSRQAFIIYVLLFYSGADLLAQPWLGTSPIYYLDGDVGIGTPTPAAKLDITGQFRAFTHFHLGNGYSANDRGITVNNGASTSWDLMHLSNDNGSWLKVLGNGNVGVGTGSPASRFQVDGLSGFSHRLRISNPSVGASASYDISLGSDQYAAGLRGYVPAGQPGYDRVFLGLYTTTYNSGVQSRIERLTISDAGNVGIGTVSPQSKFEIRHGADTPLAFIRQDKNNGGSSEVVYLRDDRGYSGNNTGTSFKVESWKGPGLQGGTLANFITINDGVPTSRLVIDNTTGNVGIEAPAPVAKFQVNSIRPVLIKNNGGQGVYGSEIGFNTILNTAVVPNEIKKLGGTGQNGGANISVDYHGNMRFQMLTGGNEAEYITQYAPQVSFLNNGNVGIGTMAPNQKLTVNGTIYGKEVKVDLSVPGPDYVFEKDYVLPSLEEVKSYLDQYKHLPEVPTAKEMEANGVKLGEMNMLLLKKVEELTLYQIEANEQIRKLIGEVERLKGQASRN